MGSLPELMKPLTYPDARRDKTVEDNYHGFIVPDPYRWLEDPTSQESKKFVADQDQLTESLLQTCGTRDKLRKHISRLNDRARYTCPFRRGNIYFYFHNSGLQAHNVLYMQNGLEGKAEVLFDPNELGKDGITTLKIHKVSENAEFLAVGLSSKGSDWMNIKVIHTADKKMLPDTLAWVKYSPIAWTQDSKGFFYCRFPTPMKAKGLDQGTENAINLNHQVYYHFLGTNQSDDILCWEDRQNPKWMLHMSVTEDGNYIILYINEGCKSRNMVYYCSIDNLSQGLEGFKGKETMLPFQKLIDKFDAHYYFVGNNGTHFTFRTNKDAPKYKLVRVDIESPESWTDVIQESEKDTLISAHCVNRNQLLVCYLRDVKYVLQVRDLERGFLLQNLPIDIGTISSVCARAQDSMAFITFRSFLTPSIVYKCDLGAEKPTLQVFRESTINGFDRNEFESKQVFVPTKDGTKIPMFIVSKKKLILDGTNPALLYGYGGFNISITPSFNTARIITAKHMGVVCAFANIRGGGEYGDEWHQSGSLLNKHICFDNSIASAELLIKEGCT
eukprot:TRINITY_DN13545_c0_g1_i1.p1 TRINITY_DN13545_c0_g1~~TRINITY_DN13545_c0_g1_i1.p1  ORF type:complete len:558 (+),score=100.41 TRINITY_DN13545_c0_g1_i1:22-1695(+)